LWTTWCPPCREEMPSMERLYRQLRDKGFVLLAVSQDEAGQAAVAPFVRPLGRTFPRLVDPPPHGGDPLCGWGSPATFIIDREGRVVERVIGPRKWDSPKQVEALEALLSAPTNMASAGTGAVP